MKTIRLFTILILIGTIFSSCITSYSKNGIRIYFPGFTVRSINWDKMQGVWFQEKGPADKDELYETGVDSIGPYHVYRSKIWIRKEGSFIGFLSIKNSKTQKSEWVYTNNPTIGEWYSFTWEYTPKIYWDERGYWRR